MPTYEYECRACNHSFERTQSMSEEPVKICPECGKDVRRVINGGAGIIFKGSGFYVNDSRGKSTTISNNSKNNSQAGDATGGESSAGTASANNASPGTAGKRPSGDSASPSAASVAATGAKAGAKAEPKAGAKESA